ncbi:MAG: preprotein translocase subunit SecE [Actinobacteria bacterium]|nr:preprotein translocase subunit SecE [Actinomycetota bacterium]MBV8562112.1 preprotein translocase subunit SecE [Actinomycetota bacterium]
MARQTRQQRRQRRAQQQPAVAAGPSPQQPAMPASRAPEPREAKAERSPRPERRPAERQAPAPVRFVQESIAELKKVEWPSQQAVVSGTAVVLIACLVVGAYLWLNDELWKYVVQHILLR